MATFDRAWLARPILSALGCGTVIGLGCGGAVAPGSEYLDEMGGVGQAGSAMAGGGTGGRSSGGGGTGGPAPGQAGGTGGRTSAGGSGGTGTAGYAGDGGAGGVSGSAGSSGNAGSSSMAGNAGSFGMAGNAGSFGMAGNAGSSGMAGSTSMPEESICLGVDSLLQGLPSSAFGIPDEQIARDSCGNDYEPGYIYQIICLPRPVTGQSCSSFYPEGLIGGLYSCGLQQGAEFVCGPSTPPPGSVDCAGDECCYVLGGGCPVGRPFLVHDEARTAASEQRTDWLQRQQPELRSLDPATRRALADAYRKDGLSEHASVASFARFVLELLALGAPADLVSEAQAALADEIAHAQLSFGLASAYAGSAVGPGALDVSDALVASPDVRDSLRRAIREGCIAETVSASLLRGASQAAEDPAVKAVLERVASDERRHAVLAWRFVRWLIAREGHALTELAAEEFAQAPRHVGFGALTELSGDARALRAHGYLAVEERRAIALQTLRQVVEPCAQQLLRGSAAGTDSTAPESAPASA